MSTFRRIVSKLDRIPRGHPADGRMIGLGLAMALDTEHRRATSEAIEAGRQVATTIAIDTSYREQAEHGHHPG